MFLNQCCEMHQPARMLQHWAPRLRGRTVSLQVENRSVVAYLLKEGGTRSRPLCLLTMQVFHLCQKLGIALRPAYLPGVANVAADALSRGRQVVEWHLNPTVVGDIFSCWGQPEVDLFASRETAQVPA